MNKQDTKNNSQSLINEVVYVDYNYRWLVMLLHILIDLCQKTISCLLLAVGAIISYIYEVDPIKLNMPFIISNLLKKYIFIVGLL